MNNPPPPHPPPINVLGYGSARTSSMMVTFLEIILEYREIKFNGYEIPPYSLNQQN